MNEQKHLDKLFIKDLMARCIIGVKPEERDKKQDVSINITLYGDLRQACRTDKIDDTIDYVSIKKKVLKMAETSSFYLIEALAEKISGICFEDRLVEKVIVNIKKPGALRFAKIVGVEIHRERPIV